MGTIRGKTLFDSFRQFGVRSPCTCAWVAALGILLWVLTSSSAAQSNGKNVLLLYDPSISGSPDLLESSVRAHVPWPVDFSVESLESLRFADKAYEKSVAGSLQRTYTGQKLDLVMVSAYPTLQFALTHRDELFPGVPIVFFDVASIRLMREQMWPGVTGVTNVVDLPATINLALRLHPDASTLATITSNPSVEFHKYWLGVVHDELLREHNRVKEVDLAGFPTDDLVKRLDQLTSQTVVLYGISPRESIQPALGIWEILARIEQRLPTYCLNSLDCLKHGGIGGYFYDHEEQNSLAAQLAGKVLTGERPENIPVLHGSRPRFYANWQALQRWHIPASALPPGSVILYRPPTFWEQYRKYVITAIALILAQALLLIGLLWQRARKRKAEAILRESEERFRVMADTTPSLIWMCDERGRVTYLNDQWLAFTGADPDTGYGDSWVTYVHPDDLKNVSDVLSHALKVAQPFSQECRLRRSDGAYRWILSVGSPRVNGDGSFAGFIGSAIDTTDQKIASQALEKLSGQLIEAQEKERSRIARDLHDDICQRLALLSMELDQADGSPDGSSGTTKENLEKIRKHCSEIADDVQSLSHQLHSSKLELLGIVAAIKGFCKEFSKQHEVNIEFTDRDVPQYLPKDISLCLFRVTQEALHNAVKYSGTSSFTVEIHATADEVQLAVSDSGAGFDVEEAKMSQGLGLVSMQERVHLVQGKLLIESGPGKGTKILALVPTVPDNQNAFEDRTVRQAERVKEVA